MSDLYTDLTLLAYGKVSTPTNNDIVGMIPSKNQPFLVTAVMAVVQVAGAQANSVLRLRKKTGPVTIVDTAIATGASGTSYDSQVAEASRLINAGEALELIHVTSDASAIYWYEVYGTYNFC